MVIEIMSPQFASTVGPGYLRIMSVYAQASDLNDPGGAARRLGAAVDTVLETCIITAARPICVVSESIVMDVCSW